MGLSLTNQFSGRRTAAAETGCELTVFLAAPSEALEDFYCNQARSKRPRFITLFHTATKSFRNFSWESSHP